MQYYIGKLPDGSVESLNTPMSPLEADARYSVYTQINEPVRDYIYEHGVFKPRILTSMSQLSFPIRSSIVNPYGGL